VFHSKGQKDSIVATNEGPTVTAMTTNKSTSPEKLLMSQVVQQEALTRLLMERDIQQGDFGGDGEGSR